MAKTKVTINGSARWIEVRIENNELILEAKAKTEQGYIEPLLEVARYDLSVTPLHTVEYVIRGCGEPVFNDTSKLVLIDENGHRHVMRYNIEYMLNAIRKAVVASYL